ncbi:ATP synthase F1, delta subunit [Gloeothece citriformis PCC 7424]|uniref:ATP synthase subunit delta n=1 Tax=Gloeothece citriformis (strain PCC 7424) TaxID=65393 RepID=ATPD_GLOC7|nr:ATP synthase F1 subunit delta [Gloeothece citriformis]B7KKR5.1 RecName: Full=ATP synthase subunit delta; AltName: Full=ATP synthase F(1) sector subunit delta; AltName: Full=F-type ATPase subunit delta; Short=F-ATPase subunit delta [Gloeothece citriformis PCC 7424]ACK71034.1 ATP synthase F1, delta subunit [Gloeothece citriformis PCC 7424]
MKGSSLSLEIAEPYAQALMSVSQSNNLTERFGEDIRSLLDLLNNSPELREFLSNPVIREENKKEILQRIMGDQTHPYLRNFLMLLVDKRRIAFLEQVCEQYLALLRQLTNTVLAEVVSATELNDEQRQSVIDKVKTISGAQAVELKASINPDLIGGVIIKIGSQILDASIRGQLRRISLSLGGV